ncbi:MAG: SHOCT domain-containing protein [Alphaproteobacteria bacterium]|nr:SHOCT domain-containing protein [Alphaproteobacteria bacterium]
MDIEKLEKINELKEKGIISEEEFNKMKKELMSETQSHNAIEKNSNQKEGINWKNVGISFFMILIYTVLMGRILKHVATLVYSSFNNSMFSPFEILLLHSVVGYKQIIGFVVINTFLGGVLYYLSKISQYIGDLLFKRILIAMFFLSFISLILYINLPFFILKTILFLSLINVWAMTYQFLQIKQGYAVLKDKK